MTMDSEVEATNAGQRGAKLGLIVPCFNEEHRLDTQAFREFLRVPVGPFLLFVDDGSTDKTATLLDLLVESGAPRRAEVLRLPQNVGKAEAVRQGLLHLLDRGEFNEVGFWDADLATPFEAIDDFLGILRRNTEVQWVLGARVQLLGRDIRRRAIRHYLGRVFATAVSLTLALPVYDTQCGAKIFRASSALRRVLEEPFLSRWIFDVEMIARLLAQPTLDSRTDPRRTIYELPLQRWIDVAGSKVRVRDFLRASIDLIRINRSLP